MGKVDSVNAGGSHREVVLVVRLKSMNSRSVNDSIMSNPDVSMLENVVVRAVVALIGAPVVRPLDGHLSTVENGRRVTVKRRVARPLLHLLCLLLLNSLELEVAERLILALDRVM